MDFLIQFAQVVVTLPPFNEQTSDHRDDDKGDSRGKSNALRDFLLPHGTALLINIVAEYVILEHIICNSGYEFVSDEIRNQS